MGKTLSQTMLMRSYDVPVSSDNGSYLLDCSLAMKISVLFSTTERAICLSRVCLWVRVNLPHALDSALKFRPVWPPAASRVPEEECKIKLLGRPPGEGANDKRRV